MKEKIKILMVMGNTGLGGTQAFVLNLLHGLDLNRYQVDFVVNNEVNNGGIGDELRSMGCNIYILPYFKVYNYFSFVRKWEAFLKSHEYDIVHGHSTNSAALYLKIAKQRGCKTISHCHSSGFRGNKLQQLMKRYYSRKVKEVADYWFACSSTAAKHLYGTDYEQYGNYYEIPDGIYAKKYLYNRTVAESIRNKEGFAEDDFVYGHVGTFSIPKNHFFLIEVFKEICKINPRAKLMCCGAGALMPDVKKKAQEEGVLDRIVFPGVVRNCNEYLMAMDTFIFPSLFEGFGIAVLEAEATGLPVFISDVIPKDLDLIDCVHRLSLKDSPKEWAERICKETPKNREQYNKTIVDTKYNIETTIKLVSSLYDKMIKI